MWDLENKKAVITGGTKGIGRSTVYEFLRLGAEVLFIARNREDVDNFIQELNDSNVHGMTGDISDSEGRSQILDFVEHQWGQLDVLVNNVGTNIRKPTLDTSLDDLREVMRVNVEAAYELCKGTFPFLKKSTSSSIVNVSSVASKLSISTSTAIYAMSKAALDQMNNFLAVEWGKYNIRLNTVHPWYINTPLVAKVLEDESKRKSIIDATPMQRVGNPEEVARVITFLAMPASSYVSGVNMEVDGAFSKKGI